MPNLLDLPLELREEIYEHYFLSLLLVYPPDQKLIAPRAGLLATNIAIGFEAAGAGYRYMREIRIADVRASLIRVESFKAAKDTMTEEEIAAWSKGSKERVLKFRRMDAMLAALSNMLSGERKFDDLPLNERH